MGHVDDPGPTTAICGVADDEAVVDAADCTFAAVVAVADVAD
jgi:hypothetical protein